MTKRVMDSMRPAINQQRSATWHGPSIYAVCMSALLLTSCQEPNLTDGLTARPQVEGAGKNPPLPAEYVVIAKHLADSHRLERNSDELRPGMSYVVAEFKGALMDIKGLKAVDPEVMNVAAEVSRATESTITALEQLDALPKPPGSGEMFVDGLLRGFVGDFAGGVQRANEVDGQLNAIKRQARNLTSGLRQLQTAKLQLPRLARKHGGPTVVRGQTVLIDYDEAWGPHGPKSEVTFTNNFGDLHNCTILVEIQGAAEVSQNVHFIANWKGGSPIYATYDPGVAILDETPIKQTVPAVQRVVVSIWADEFSQENIRYQYAGNEQAKDVARYCKDLRVSAKYREFQKGTVWNTQRGVQLQLDGIEFIERPRVTISFRRGQENKALYWDLERWEAGECKTLDTQGSLAWDPDEILVEIGFPTTSYKYVSSWKMSN